MKENEIIDYLIEQSNEHLQKSEAAAAAKRWYEAELETKISIAITRITEHIILKSK